MAPHLVEKVFLITLDIREDRRAEFFNRYPNPEFFPEVEVFPAIHGDTCQPPDNWASGAGAWGCYRSHLAILEHCLNSGVGSYVVFEDDSQFRPDFNEYVPKVFGALPEEWQQLYLGGQLLHERTHAPVKENEFVYRPWNVNRTHCFGVSRDGMLPIYKHICNLPFVGGEHIDHHLGRLHESMQFGVYCPGRWMVGQGGSASNVSGKKDPVNFWQDPESLASDHWLCEDPVCIVFRGPPGVRKELYELHSGFTKDAAGFDKGLTVAVKYADPAPEINRWYSYVRNEVIKRPGKFTLPCLFHPRVTEEMLSRDGIAFRPLYVFADSVDEAREKIADLLPGRKVVP